MSAMTDEQSLEACLEAVGGMVANVTFTEQEAQAIANAALKWWVVLSLGAEWEEAIGDDYDFSEKQGILTDIIRKAGKEIHVNIDRGKLAAAWKGDQQ